MRVLLIIMPFCTTKWPALGISLLKSTLREAGFDVDVKYFNIEFAKRVSMEWYEETCLNSAHLMGERLFAEAYFGSHIAGSAVYDRKLQEADLQNQHFIRYLQEFRKHIPSFLDQCLNAIDYGTYNIVGFTTMFEQNLASIALADLIKKHYPDVPVIFGGANCSDEMGLELHRLFPCIDYVLRGEADHAFPELIRRLETGKNFTDIQGLVYRKDHESIAVGVDAMITDLDQLPVPDYDDYFIQLNYSTATSLHCEEIPMETSRGCWWGYKHQCRFCGLNANTICYRSKKPEAVIKELDSLVDRYCVPFGISRVSMVDNILDMSYFSNLIPMLEENPPKVDLFFEVKSNLSLEQVKKLSKARICWVQPGIESLNNHVLKLMNKGVSALQNIQLLKSLKQHGIYPTWNIIYGFPGEIEEDYRSMTGLIYNITHLDPPEGVTKVALQRFSPYFRDPAQYNMVHIRPEEAYNYIYPFMPEQISRLAYFFDYDYVSDIASSVIEDFLNAINYWIFNGANGKGLSAREISPYAMIITNRPGHSGNSALFLYADQKEVYQFLNEMHSLSSVTSFLKSKHANIPVEENSVKDFLDEMVTLGLMIKSSDTYLSLAISE